MVQELIYAFLMRLIRFVSDVLHLYRWYNAAIRVFMAILELDIVPDFITRRGIRFLLGVRRDTLQGTVEKKLQRKLDFVQELKTMPIAIQTAAANEQHYEVPTEYFRLVLGKWKKYSCCLYNSPYDSLNQAEQNMLALYCLRAGLKDGHDVLELGCGWGSLSLFVAQAYPNSRVTAVSNSATQKAFIDERARELDVHNLTVITADMVEFQATASYDRILSIEMFEHMKNYQELMRRISTWLRPGGQLFIHIFCHKSMPYHFEVHGEDDWMARYFFSGGTMPSLDLFLYFQQHLNLSNQWWVNGQHYSRTLEAWLRNHDKKRRLIMPIFASTYSSKAALKWFVYWRLFYLACSELFNYEGGEEWGVGHYLFTKPAVAPAALPNGRASPRSPR